MTSLSLADLILQGKAVSRHWKKVDGVLKKPLRLAGGVTRAAFDANLARLEAERDAMPGIDNAYGLALAAREAGKTPLKTRLKQFRSRIEGELDGSAFEEELPLQPARNASEAEFLKPMRDMADLWERVEAAKDLGDFETPLILPGDYERADFVAEVAALAETYERTRNAIDAGVSERIARKSDSESLWNAVVRYKKAVVGRLAEGHPLLEELP